MLRLKLMFGTKVEDGFDVFDAGFRVAIQSLCNGRLRRQSLFAERVVIPGDGVYWQTVILEQRRAAHLSGDNFD